MQHTAQCDSAHVDVEQTDCKGLVETSRGHRSCNGTCLAACDLLDT